MYVFSNKYIHISMSQRSNALDVMPTAALAQLRALGEHLAIARKRRHASRKAWAQRLAVSEPTLARMEKGDPSVSMGVYATALWLVGRSAQLAELAAPQHDQGALESEVRAALQRSARQPARAKAKDPA